MWSERLSVDRNNKRKAEEKIIRSTHLRSLSFDVEKSERCSNEDGRKKRSQEDVRKTKQTGREGERLKIWEGSKNSEFWASKRHRRGNVRGGRERLWQRKDQKWLCDWWIGKKMKRPRRNLYAFGRLMDFEKDREQWGSRLRIWLCFGEIERIDFILLINAVRRLKKYFTILSF